MIVFNTNNRDSFKGVKKWIDITFKSASGDLQVIFIMGLKQKEQTKDFVSEEEWKKWYDSLESVYKEVI